MPPIFAPILAGATFRDRLVASAGALVGIALTSLVALTTLGPSTVPLLVAPIGASAVLVFAVPASPLAQPWPVVGGNTLSALVGVAVAKLVPVPHLAAGLAVGLAILAMSLARCLHPPGGAAALIAVIGGPAVTAAGWRFAAVPVAADAVLLVLVGLAFHRVSGHAWPHRQSTVPVEPHPQDLDAALAAEGEAFDIARDDLAALVARVEAARRTRLAAAARLRQRRGKGEA